MTRFAARLVLGVLAAAIFAAPGTAAVSTVSICDFSQHPDRYYGKLVQVRARVFSDIENATLADVHCAHTQVGFRGVFGNPNAVQLSRAVYPQYRALVVATLTGRLVPPAKLARGMPVFDVETATDVKTKSGVVCPWTSPPMPPRGLSRPQAALLRRNDPCAPDNWLRTHPGWSE